MPAFRLSVSFLPAFLRAARWILVPGNGEEFAGPVETSKVRSSKDAPKSRGLDSPNAFETDQPLHVFCVSSLHWASG